jgi:DNA-binding XRE family transcriptional regulator
MSLAEMCRELRSVWKMSQYRFAEIVGTTQTEISFIENGFVPRDPNKVKTINDLFHAAFPGYTASEGKL